MKISATTRKVTAQPAEAAVVGLYEDGDARRGSAAAVDGILDGLIGRVLEAGEFKGKYGTASLLHAPEGVPFRRVILVGLGKRGDLDVRRLIGAAVALGRFAADKGCTSLVMPALGREARGIGVPESVAAVAEGLERSTFDVGSLKSERETTGTIEEVFIADLQASDRRKARRAIDVGAAVGAGANLARDLANTPGNRLSPAELAERAQAVAVEGGLEVEVLDEKTMKQLGMGAILAVGQGSSRPPRMVVLRHAAGRGDRCVAFVGKGITFDSGGISIKPSSGMEKMKYDMSGAATVLGAMHAVARIKPKVNVLGLMGCAENLPGPTASRPGDVVAARTGTTIEIITTDAEGRLVLADTLAYAIEQGATHLVDLATLTGACSVALGAEAAGLMTNSAGWARDVQRAAKRAGERLWELPMFDEYRDAIVSKVADIKNVGKAREAGTIAGGMFLREFVGDTPWVHLDIAGVAWADNGKPHRPYGPTGFGVGTLVQLVL